MKFRQAFVIMITLFSVTPLWAQQEKEIYHNAQFWWSLNTTVRFSQRWGMVADYHHRLNDFMSERNFYFARIGGAFWASDKLTLVGGYAHLWLANRLVDDGFAFADENRIYQQAQWRQREGRVTFVNRVRNEQRWRELLNPDGSLNRTYFTNRIRLLFSAAVAVFDNPYLPQVSIADELHFQVGEEAIFNTFDQNRIFVGIRQRIDPQITFDIGYMMVYQQRFSGFEYDMNHTLRWFFYWSPDFRKSKDGPHYSIPGDE